MKHGGITSSVGRRRKHGHSLARQFVLVGVLTVLRVYFPSQVATLTMLRLGTAWVGSLLQLTVRRSMCFACTVCWQTAPRTHRRRALKFVIMDAPSVRPALQQGSHTLCSVEPTSNVLKRWNGS